MNMLPVNWEKRNNKSVFYRHLAKFRMPVKKQNYNILILFDMKTNIYDLTNDSGKKFLRYFKDVTFIGIERTASNIDRKEFTAIYRNRENKVSTIVLPDNDTNNNGSCFFGSLAHFAIISAMQQINKKVLYNGCKIVWPVWYLDRNDFKTFLTAYNAIIDKYTIMQ